MRPVVSFLLVLLCGLPLRSAETASANIPASSSAKKSAAAKKDGGYHDYRPQIGQLKAGLTRGDVNKLLGAPERRVQKKETPVGPVEAWIYHSRYTAGTRNVQTGSTTYQRPNPMTGVMETITDPIMGVETTFVSEEHVLVFKDGKLIEWKSTVTDRSTTTS